MKTPIHEKSGYSWMQKLPHGIISSVGQAVDKLMAAFRADEIIETVRNKIKRVIGAAKERLTPQEAADKVVDAVFGPEATEQHATAIAQTENTGAVGAGGKAAQDHLFLMGQVNAKKWVRVRDNLVRPTHIVAGNLPAIPIHDKFVVGGHQCDHPGDPSLPAEERCNCRCYSVSLWVPNL